MWAPKWAFAEEISFGGFVHYFMDYDTSLDFFWKNNCIVFYVIISATFWDIQYVSFDLCFVKEWKKNYEGLSFDCKSSKTF